MIIFNGVWFRRCLWEAIHFPSNYNVLHFICTMNWMGGAKYGRIFKRFRYRARMKKYLQEKKRKQELGILVNANPTPIKKSIRNSRSVKKQLSGTTSNVLKQWGCEVKGYLGINGRSTKKCFTNTSTYFERVVAFISSSLFSEITWTKIAKITHSEPSKLFLFI